MRKLRSIFGLSLTFSCLLLCQCKKTERTVTVSAQPDSAYLSITNASPSISNLLFYDNNQFVPFPDSPFSFGSTTFGNYVINSGDQLHPIVQQLPYIKIPAGYDQLGFRSTSPAAAFDESGYFANGAKYSVFITDSVSHGQAQYVLLTDNTVATDTTQGQIRFVNLSPDAPALDLYAFLNVGPNGIEVASNCGYILNDYQSLLNAETFIPITAGPYYLVATVAGTYNAVLDGGLIIRPKSVTTVYVMGFFNGSGPSLANVGVISYRQQ